MSKLITTRNSVNADHQYALLVAAHEGKTKTESDAFNARLIITLFNHIGADDIIVDALKIAEM